MLYNVCIYYHFERQRIACSWEKSLGKQVVMATRFFLIARCIQRLVRNRAIKYQNKQKREVTVLSMQHNKSAAFFTGTRMPSRISLNWAHHCHGLLAHHLMANVFQVIPVDSKNVLYDNHRSTFCCTIWIFKPLLLLFLSSLFCLLLFTCVKTHTLVQHVFFSKEICIAFEYW